MTESELAIAFGTSEADHILLARVRPNAASIDLSFSLQACIPPPLVDPGFTLSNYQATGFRKIG
jgi:hypothetical protein